MRLILLFLVFGLAATQLPASDTLYKALNTVGTAKGDRFLNSLVVAEGLSADTQPKLWRFVFDDPAAQGGVRDIEVAEGAIVSESTPRRNPFGRSEPVPLNKLQLDSDGAFAVANAMAKRRKLGFDSVNFLLRTDESLAAPVWRVELLDSEGAIVSTVSVSADTGLVTKFEGSERHPDVASSEEEYVSDDEDDVSTPGSPEQKIHRGFLDIGHAFKRGFRTLGGSVQEVFTGRRTFDKDYRNKKDGGNEDSSSSSSSSDYDSDYVKPTAPPPQTVPDD